MVGLDNNCLTLLKLLWYLLSCLLVTPTHLEVSMKYLSLLLCSPRLCLPNTIVKFLEDQRVCMSHLNVHTVKVQDLKCTRKSAKFVGSSFTKI